MNVSLERRPADISNDEKWTFQTDDFRTFQTVLDNETLEQSAYATPIVQGALFAFE